MNDTLELLARRRSAPPQALTDPAPTAADVDALLRLAARVPDHGKLAPWRFIVIEGDARERVGKAIAEAFRADEPDASPERVDQERRRLTRAPLVIAVVSRARPHAKIPEWEQVLSAGAVCQNLIVAATAMGFGATWLTEWIAFDRRVLDRLGLEPDERLAGYFHVGRRPAEAIPDRPRPDLADIVTRL